MIRQGAVAISADVEASSFGWFFYAWAYAVLSKPRQTH